MKKDCAESFIVSFNFDVNGDINLAIIGQRDAKGEMQIVNAYEGDNAKALYELVSKKETFVDGEKED